MLTENTHEICQHFCFVKIPCCVYFNFSVIGLAVFVQSPAAYEALKNFNTLQLPSRAMLQAYTGAFLHKTGAAAESIREVQNSLAIL